MLRRLPMIRMPPMSPALVTLMCPLEVCWSLVPSGDGFQLRLVQHFLVHDAAACAPRRLWSVSAMVASLPFPGL